MHLNTTQIEQASILWVLVADGETAQIYLYHQHQKLVPMHDTQESSFNKRRLRPKLTVVPDSAFEAQSLKDFHVGHDQRGSKIGGAHSGHNTCEPHLDIRDEVKQNLVHAVAEKLKQACEAKLFDRLVIAASPKILGALRSQLGPNVMSHVIGEIDKDFTKDNYNELVEHLRATFTSAHVV